MYHFIANPNARSVQGLALWEKIKLKLIAEHIDYQIHFTHHRHHATEIAAELTASGDPVTIVVLGGDGSVDEVICGLQNLSRVTLGYIPIGSGNDFGNICNHNKVQQIIIRFGIRAEFASTTFIRKIKCRGKENPFKMKSFGIVQKNFHLIWLTATQTVE